jgi:hypothetical protein
MPEKCYQMIEAHELLCSDIELYKSRPEEDYTAEQEKQDDDAVSHDLPVLMLSRIVRMASLSAPETTAPLM